MVKRYDTVGVGGEADERECPDGDFVRYEDHVAALKHERERANRIQAKLDAANHGRSEDTLEFLRIRDRAEKAERERDEILLAINDVLIDCAHAQEFRSHGGAVRWIRSHVGKFKAETERRVSAEKERAALLAALNEILDDSEGPLEFRYIRQIARNVIEKVEGGEGEPMKRPQLVREWVGLLCRTKRKLANGFGNIPTGSLVVVTSTYRGAVCVETAEACSVTGIKWSCSKVSLDDLIPMDRVMGPKPPQRRPR